MKVVLPTPVSVAPSTQSAHAKGLDPTPGDKAPIPSLTFAAMEVLASDKAPVLVSQPFAGGQTSKEAEKEKLPEDQREGLSK